MKALIVGMLLTLSLSLSLSAAVTPAVQCKDFKGNVLTGSLDELKNVLSNPNPNRPQVLITGVIADIKKEDHSGLPHQKFTVKVDSNITLLIVSNLDFGRIPLVVGKTISVCGEFKKIGNGMVHWTHFDPHGPHADGFTILDGKLYGDTETN